MNKQIYKKICNLGYPFIRQLNISTLITLVFKTFYENPYQLLLQLAQPNCRWYPLFEVSDIDHFLDKQVRKSVIRN